MGKGKRERRGRESEEDGGRKEGKGGEGIEWEAPGPPKYLGLEPP